MISVREASMHEKGFRYAFIGGEIGEQGRQIDLPFSEKAVNITCTYIWSCVLQPTDPLPLWVRLSCHEL